MGTRAWRTAAAGLAAALVWGGTALAADSDTYQSSSRNAGRSSTSTAIPVNDWWWPFGRSELRAARTPMDAAKAQTATAAAAPDSAGFRAMSPKETAAQVSQAMAVYARRQEVCDRIRQIAEDTGDAAMEAQAELMQQRAWMLCQQRLSQLRMPGLLPEKETDAEAVLTAEKKSMKPARAEAKPNAPVRSVRGESSSGGERE